MGHRATRKGDQIKGPGGVSVSIMSFGSTCVNIISQTYFFLVFPLKLSTFSIASGGINFFIFNEN